MAAIDPVAAQRRRLDRMILVWPAAGIFVAAASCWEDMRIGRSITWGDFVAGIALFALGAVIYVACRWRLRSARRLIEAIRSS